MFLDFIGVFLDVAGKLLDVHRVGPFWLRARDRIVVGNGLVVGFGVGIGRVRVELPAAARAGGPVAKEAGVGVGHGIGAAMAALGRAEIGRVGNHVVHNGAT